MRGPLKTIIRNRTGKALSYNTIPKLYIQPGKEFVLEFDPFSKWSSSNALETLLVDAKKGNIQIVYQIDSEYAVPAPSKDMVKLSRIGEAAIGLKPEIPQPRPAVKPLEAPKRVPLGKTADELVAEERKELREKAEKSPDTLTVEEQKRLDIQKLVESRTPQEVNLDKLSERLSKAETTLTMEPDKLTDEKATKPEEPKKGGRKKKTVVTL